MDRFFIGKTQSFAGMKAVNEINPALLRLPDQLQQRSPLFLRIRFAPALAMIRIVFRRVKISIDAASGAKFKQGFAVIHGPGRAKKSFNEPAALEELAFHHLTILHRAKQPTRFPCQ
jgi:hypothetical protein